MIKHGKHTYSVSGLTVGFECDANLIVGDYCSIAGGCNVLLGGEHRSDWISTFPFTEMFDNSPEIQGYRTSKGDVVIGNDVWIGYGVTILSGVTIGDGAIIGSCSLVAKDVKPYSIVCGNPAVHKRFRFSEDEINQLLFIKWWDWPEDDVRGAIPILMKNDIGKLVEYNKKRGEQNGN